MEYIQAVTSAAISGHEMTPLNQPGEAMPNLLSAKRRPKRKIAPVDQLKAADDIDTTFTMSTLVTIINFGQILEIKTVTLIKKLLLK